MKRIRNVLLLLWISLAMLLVTACTTSPKELDLGITEDGTYKNDYFGVSVQYPKEWKNEAIGPMGKIKKGVPGPVILLRVPPGETMDLAEADYINLLSAPNIPQEGELKPTIMLTAVKISSLPNIKTAKDFMELTKNDLKRTSSEFTLKDSGIATIGGKEMYKLVHTVNKKGFKHTREWYTAIIKDYALIIVVYNVDDESKAVTDEILKSVSFK